MPQNPAPVSFLGLTTKAETSARWAAAADAHHMRYAAVVLLTLLLPQPVPRQVGAGVIKTATGYRPADGLARRWRRMRWLHSTSREGRIEAG